MRTLAMCLLIVIGVGAAGWWLHASDVDVTAPPDEGAAPVAAKPAEKVAVANVREPAQLPAVKQAAGSISFRRPDIGETLDLPVAGGAALWDPSASRLRVLLTDEVLSPADQRQLLEYVRDERMADAGRRFALLDLQFQPGTTTPDPGSLTAASLTVAGAGNLEHDTADVLGSVQWTGGMQPGNADAPLTLTTTGDSRPAGGAAQQTWSLQVTLPVVRLDAVN